MLKLSSLHTLPTQKQQKPLEKWLIPDLDEKMYQTSQKHLALHENKTNKTTGTMFEGDCNQPTEASSSQRQGKLAIKKNLTGMD